MPTETLPKKRRLSRKQAAREPEVQLNDNIRPMLEVFWASLNKAMAKEDPRALKLFAEIANYIKAPGGVSIINQNLNAAANAGDAPSKIRSFDQIIGKLEDAKQLQGRALLAQPEDVESIIDAEIEDAETEDLPEAAA